MGWRLAERVPDLALKTVKLENRKGLDEARQCGIKTIPTIIISRGKTEFKRFIGLPVEDELQEALHKCSGR